jgi:hypothetical protein
MKPSRYTNSQILGILKPAESGIPVSQLCESMAWAASRFTNGAPSTAA